MISCDLLYIRAIKYYKLPMINPEIATSLKLWSFSLCSALPCCLICKCRQRKKITARCHQCMGKLAETCPGNPLLSLIIWSGFTFLLRSEFGDQCDPEHEKNRPPATTIWDFSIAPENLDDLFRISTFALQNCWCTSGEKKKKRWNKARPKTESYHEDVRIVLSIESACPKFSSFQCWETPSYFRAEFRWLLFLYLVKLAARSSTSW